VNLICFLFLRKNGSISNQHIQKCYLVFENNKELSIFIFFERKELSVLLVQNITYGDKQKQKKTSFFFFLRKKKKQFY